QSVLLTQDGGEPLVLEMDPILCTKVTWQGHPWMITQRTAKVPTTFASVIHQYGTTTVKEWTTASLYPESNTLSIRIIILRPYHSFFGSNIEQGEAPCAICKVIRGTLIMIPGRKDCYPGWTKEYSGYLVGGYPGYGDSSELVYLDRRPEVLLDDGKFQSEKELFFVEAHCNGGLTCPPYVNGRELSCST
ncbi:hypothetical protein MAR_035229, partial [Mya arenaria]